MTVLVVLIVAVLLDALLGETKRFHPLVGFGSIAKKVEQKLNTQTQSRPQQRLLGVVAWASLVLPLPIIYQLFLPKGGWWLIVDIVVVYVAIGLTSLAQHAKAVYMPLKNNEIEQARLKCSYLVSRDTSELNSTKLSRATTESVLENGHDAFVATLFWFVIGGAPLVIAHRLVNTLDAMWGYKTPRFINFGWCSARMDDVMGWPSAKVTSVLYALQAPLPKIMKCLTNAYSQSKTYKSLNGGWVMASGSTALNLKLGGQSQYFGEATESPILGQGNTVEPADILASVKLVNRAGFLFILFVGLLFALYQIVLFQGVPL